jgi:protein-S-isoprenylcysteine O-methyltransferase Ste14
MTETSDHPQITVRPPLVCRGYLIGSLSVNWAVPFPTPCSLILRVVGGLAVAAGILLSPLLIATMARSVIHAEEVYLDGKFPHAYKEYYARVRRWVQAN